MTIHVRSKLGQLSSRKLVIDKKIKKRIFTTRLIRYASLDEVAAQKTDGLFVAPMSPNKIRYQIRQLDRYCKEHGRKPESLTEEELKQFIIK